MPYFLALPPAYAPWMRTMVAGCLRLCDELKLDPSPGLIEPALRALADLEGEGRKDE